MKKKALGSYWKSIRENLGMTQADVAEKAEMTQQRYQNYEAGRSTPPLRIYSKINKILGIKQCICNQIEIE